MTSALGGRLSMVPPVRRPGAGNDAVEINKLRVPGKHGWLSFLFALEKSVGDGDSGAKPFSM